MDDVGGVADQDDAGFDVGVSVLQAERKRRPWPDLQNRSQARFKRRRQCFPEVVVIQRQQPGGPFRQVGPDDGTSAVGQWQKRQRSARREALPGGFLMRFFGAHVGDHRMLVVAPAAGFDSGQLSHAGLRPVRADQQAGGEFAPVVQAHPPASILQRMRGFQRRRTEQVHRRKLPRPFQ